MKERILNVITSRRPFELGDQAVLVAPHLSEDWDVDFFWAAKCRGGTPREVSNPNWHVYAMGSRNWLGAIARLRSLLGRNRYRLIHSWGPEATALTKWALLAAGRGGQMSAWTAQLDEPTSGGCPKFGAGLSRPRVFLAEPFLAARAEFVRAIAVPLAVLPMKERHDELPRELQVPVNVKLIGTLCPLEARSGLKHLIWSLDQIKCVRDDFRLVVWGGGSQTSQLRRYARQVTVGNWIIWRGPDRDIRHEMTCLDLYWHAPRAIATPGALAAALAQGIPAIAPSTPATEQLASAFPSTLKPVAWGARDQIARQTYQWLEHGFPKLDLAAMSAWMESHQPGLVARHYAEAYRQILSA